MLQTKMTQMRKTDNMTQIQRQRLHKKPTSARHRVSVSPHPLFSLSPCLLVSVFLRLLVFISLFPLLLCGTGFEVPLEFHGSGFLGKYLNSDTIRYNMDASVELFCTLLRYHNLSLFVRYRDDLDMAEQKGGVTLDPRYTHYYISGGFDYLTRYVFLTTYIMHDCVHDIDYDVEGTPVFNRFRLRCASTDFHDSRRLATSQKFLWSVDVGFYPHWSYHGWDINAGADYKYDAIIELFVNLFQKNQFGVALNPTFTIARGDTMFYHQHVLRLMGHFTNRTRRIGLNLDYNIYNNDPIKNPDKLWLLSLFLGF